MQEDAQPRRTNQASDQANGQQEPPTFENLTSVRTATAANTPKIAEVSTPQIKRGSRNVAEKETRDKPSQPSVSHTWIQYELRTFSTRRIAPNPSRRKDVRKHAALSSAAARKATIAKKYVENRIEPRPVLQRSNCLTLASVLERKAAPDSSSEFVRNGDHSGPFMLLNLFLSDRGWYENATKGLAMAHRSIRTLLWDSIVDNNALFHASIFFAGTHSNTCGLPPSEIHNLGVGMILLRGASLDAIQASIVSASRESLTPVAIALLAGWERRYGDRESYEVHMDAWTRLPLPSKALEENSVATLTELTFESFREALNERARLSALPYTSPVHPGRLVYPAGLPAGFKIFPLTRPETRSLLNMVALQVSFDPKTPKAVPMSRRISVENMAWSLSHSLDTGPSIAYEEGWDPAEANALLHVRAAMVSISAMLYQRSMDAHNMMVTMDIPAAVAVHTVSCQHLRTEALMDTKYQDVALWCRVTLCSISRDPDRDELLRQLLRRRGIRCWAELEILLDRHLYRPDVFDSAAQRFYNILTGSA